MKHWKALLLMVAALGVGGVALTQGQQYRDASAGPDARPMKAQTKQVYDFWFRNQPAARADALTRTDLKACEAIGQAEVTEITPLTAEDFANTLQGTWIRDLTWYGTPIPTESAMYFDFSAGNGRFTAMAYDQVNLGAGVMAKLREHMKDTLSERAKIATMTFVDCDSLIVDTYYKLSSDLVFDGLPALAGQITPVSNRGTTNPLRAMFTQLSEAGFFDRHAEVAMPDNLKNRPGAELIAPSVVGAVWDGSVTPSGTTEKQGLAFHMNGEYRGTHWAPGTVQPGWEAGKFFRTGGAFVAASELGDSTLTKELANSVTLTWDRVVIIPS